MVASHSCGRRMGLAIFKKKKNFHQHIFEFGARRSTDALITNILVKIN